MGIRVLKFLFSFFFFCVYRWSSEFSNNQLGYFSSVVDFRIYGARKIRDLSSISHNLG